jgi:hypothetical protein
VLFVLQLKGGIYAQCRLSTLQALFILYCKCFSTLCSAIEGGNLSTMQTVNASLNFKGADISFVSPLAEREILSTQFACLKLLLNQ